MVIAAERGQAIMESLIANVKVHDLQADELWGFLQKKEGHKKPEEARDSNTGDCYPWVAIEARTKVVLDFHTGRRTNADAFEFARKLRRAKASDSRFQLTTDGLACYLPAVDEYISERVDFPQLIKVYKATREGEQRYSPTEIAEAVPVVVSGNP